MSEIEIGTDVTWMETKRVGTGFDLSQKEGKLIEFDGRWATVRFYNGRKATVATRELEVARRGKNKLTKAVLAMAE